MKLTQILLPFLAILTACCSPSEEVKSAARDAKTKALFSDLIESIKHYEVEYRMPIGIQNSIELADILEGKNEKRITFYILSDEDRNDAGEILDAHGNEVSVRNEENRITLHSYGRNGVMDSFPENDDIIMHYEPNLGHYRSGQN